jgi:hypothetical protein
MEELRRSISEKFEQARQDVEVKKPVMTLEENAEVLFAVVLRNVGASRTL